MRRPGRSSQMLLGFVRRFLTPALHGESISRLPVNSWDRAWCDPPGSGANADCFLICSSRFPLAPRHGSRTPFFNAFRTLRHEQNFDGSEENAQILRYAWV